MQDRIRIHRPSRDIPNTSRHEMLKNSQARVSSQDKALTQMTTEYSQESIGETEKEESCQVNNKLPSKRSVIQSNKLQKLLSKENITKGMNFFRKHGSDNDIKLTFDSTKKVLESQLTSEQKEELAVRNQRNALKRVAGLRGLAGKMYVSELWSKKQRFEMSNVSPSIAEKIQSPNLISNRKSVLESESSLAFQRKFKRKIANDLFAKYQNGIPISDKDITIDPPLYEQVIQSGLQSPSTQFLESQYLSVPQRTGPVSLRELRRNSNVRNSSEEQNSNFGKGSCQELQFGGINSLPNINVHSLLLKTGSMNQTEIYKEQVIQSQKLSYRNSLFDLNASTADLKDVSGRQSTIFGDSEKKGLVIKSQTLDTKTSTPLFKMSDKLRKLVLPDKIVEKEFHGGKREKGGRIKFTLNIRGPANNTPCGNSLNEESGMLSRSKVTLRMSSRNNPGDSEYSTRDISLNRDEKKIKLNSLKMRKDSPHKIRTVRQKENMK